MALKLATTEKGLDADYWKIIYQNTDYRTNSTQCVLALYLDKEHREAGIDNWLKLEPFQLDGIDLTREQLYNTITESKQEDKVVSEAVAEVKDAEGKIVIPAVEAVIEKVELNKWAEAESDMEVVTPVEPVEPVKEPVGKIEPIIGEKVEVVG